ncbi:aminotransferase class V-fold PLP-dependent enzyme [Kitasatospora sp. NPDC058046]|uniref:aminotransferase class V-fold PLP-dependent enzyme n=1 Tax=Kitasatospora sp. NPDC058046 TaxID=3346312 RepID=UPI0036DDD4F1
MTAGTGARPGRIYLDHASTSTDRPDAVWSAMRDYLATGGASPGRGGHRLGRQAEEIVSGARSAVAELFGIRHPADVAFTTNATHALNIAIKGLLRPGDRVVTTSLEHNSVLRPLESLRSAGRIEYEVVDVHPTLGFDLDLIESALRTRTRLLAVNHASNVTGLVAPVAELTELAHRYGALLLLDVSQTAGLLPVDVTGTGLDLLAFTGHKGLHGPPGTGGLYVRDSAQVTPLYEGGTGTSSQVLRHPAAMPARFEAGTPNTVGLAGLGAAVRLLLRDGLDQERERQLALAADCATRLGALDGVRVHHPDGGLPRVPVLSLLVDGLFPGEVAALLDERHGIMTRSGLHCAPLAHRVLGTAERGTVRLSLGGTTTTEDIDAVVGAVAQLAAEAKETR